MTFIIKKNQLNPHASHSKEFEFGNTGITVKFRPVSHPNFQRVNSLISDYQKNQNATPALEISKDAIRHLNADGLSPHEAMIYAVGECLIEDWNITVDDDGKQEKLPPNGDNLLALLGSIDNPDEFVVWCFECVGKLSQELTQLALDIKKKPSKDGSGSKTTKA